MRLAAHAVGLQERHAEIVPGGEVLDDGGATALESAVKDDGRIDVEMAQRGVGPGDGGELVAGARRQRRRMAFGGIGDGDVAGFMEHVAGIGQARLVDEDRAVTDVEPGQEGRLGQRRGAYGDADAAYEVGQPLRERIGERRSRSHGGHGDHAALARASLALA